MDTSPIGDRPATTYWPAPQSATDVHGGRAIFHGSGGPLFKIHLQNLVLSVLTLGIYYFWGRARAKAYLIGQVDFEGDHFAFHGTGPELFIGFVKTFAVFLTLAGLVFGATSLMPSNSDEMFTQFMSSFALFLGSILSLLALLAFGITVGVVVGAFLDAGSNIVDGLPFGPSGDLWKAGMLLVVFLILPLVLVGARRYQMNRTSWRGIRFSFRGDSRELMRLTARGMLMTIVTLGFWYPYFAVQRWAFLANNTQFGTASFRFAGSGRDLFRSWAITLLLLIPTFGLMWYWYQGRQSRYLWNHTQFPGGAFESDVDGADLFGLNIINGLTLMFTLGLGLAWVTTRNLEFWLRHIWLTGEADLDGIVQESRQAGPTAEAAGDFLAIGDGLF